MKLYAVADLHLGAGPNREALTEVTAHPDDWLIIAGDIGEKREHLELAFDTLAPRFRQLVWVPGNHELWTLPQSDEPARGQAKYEQCVSVCRRYGVVTPEDPYPVVCLDGRNVRIAPLALLYDYSFRPEEVAFANAVAWASESGIRCADEDLIHTDPYPDMASWCQARCQTTEARLQEACTDGLPTVLINHYPLRHELARLPRIPRFAVWCGTRRAEDWHRRFNAVAMVYGHLHIPMRQTIDGVAFHEVSFGYPKQWRRWANSINDAIREIPVA
jgi:3',5'-cyclic AMP phosphodiesterase CpdA